MLTPDPNDGHRTERDSAVCRELHDTQAEAHAAYLEAWQALERARVQHARGEQPLTSDLAPLEAHFDAAYRDWEHKYAAWVRNCGDPARTGAPVFLPPS